MTTIELRGGPAAVGAARHAIEELADQEQLPRRDDLRLLVSELVTNSILHGSAGPENHLQLHVERPDHSVRVEVCDEGGGWSESARSPSLDSDEPAGGWGLMLVGALADEWGVECGAERTCVWFQLN
ncbi:MAG TPA: ATP-binding protein [Thermoleophilaceae bacterium]|nr:ATP-binding protein [Thermoleophilaceae bacterium]